MKTHITLALAFAFFMGISLQSCAQKSGGLSKKEKKEWKKKLKSTDPSDFKAMTEKVNNLQRETNALKTQINGFDKEKEEMNAKIAEKDAKLEEMQKKMAEMEDQLFTKDVGADGDDWNTGVVYKVQVGAFRNKDLSSYQDKGSFWVEDTDGIKKYTIANFRDYQEATLFKNYMREMGVKDAWIVAYEDNLRKDINDVMSEDVEADN